MSNFTVYISYTYHKMQKFITFLDNVLIFKKSKEYYNYDRETKATCIFFMWQFEKSTFWRIFHHKSKTTSLTKNLKYDLKI